MCIYIHMLDVLNSKTKRISQNQNLTFKQLIKISMRTSGQRVKRLVIVRNKFS